MPVYICGSNLYRQVHPSDHSVVCCPTLLQEIQGHCVEDMVLTVPGILHIVNGEWIIRGKNPMLNQDFKQMLKLAVSDSGDRGIGISQNGRDVLELSRDGKKSFVLSYVEEDLKEDRNKFFKNDTGEKCTVSSIEFIWCGVINSKAIVIDKEGRLWLESIDSTHGSNLSLYPYLAVPRVKEVSCGASHAVALSTDGEVFTWGNGMRGELGIPQVSLSSSPTALPLLGGVNISRVCAGKWHCVALGACGEVYVWGWNADGQLGLPFKPSREVNSDSNPDHCCTQNCHQNTPVTSSPNPDDASNIVNVQSVPVMLTCFGDCDVIAIAAGDRHSVFLLENGDVFTCGWNRYGQLGTGCNFYSQMGMSRVTNLPGTVKDIHAGSWYTCFVV